jgi:serine/threonine-protein kinase
VGTAARLLFIDDEERVTTALRAMFRREYEVFVANSGPEAIELLRREAIDVIVSDQRMPEMTGVELLRQARELSPGAVRILLTGYADLAAIEHAINECEVFRYLMKPCPREQLRETIALAVDTVRGGGLATALAPAEAVPGDPVAEPSPEAAPSVAAVEPEAPVAEEPPAPTATPATVTPLRPRPAPTALDGRELLVLSAEESLLEAVREAVPEDVEVRQARTLAEAVDLLSVHRAGVVVTDADVDGRGVEALTAELKRWVPELVTVVVSDRADAQLMIDLINHGQVFRFLLKPVSTGQCRLWLASAFRRHEDLRARVAGGAPAPPAAAAAEAPAPGRGWSLKELGARLRAVLGRGP